MTTLSWGMGGVFERGLEREHNAFWNLVTNGERDFDPAWLANLSLLFGLCLQVMPEIMPDVTSEDLYEISLAAIQVRSLSTVPTSKMEKCLTLILYLAAAGLAKETILPSHPIFLSSIFVHVPFRQW